MEKKNPYSLRVFCLGIVLSVFLPFSLSCSLPEQEGFVVGVVNPNKGNKDITSGFIKGLETSGYEEGKNLTIIRHESLDGIEAAVAEMVAKEADLIFSVTTPATKVVMKTTAANKIPVVFAMFDPVNSGIVDNFARPQGNLTGIQIRGSTPKALEWLLKLAPAAKKIYVPVKYDTMAARQDLADLRRATDRLGIELLVAESNSKEELSASLEKIPADVDAVFLPHSIFISSNAEMITAAVVNNRLPIGSGANLYIRGATITYALDWQRTGIQASRLGRMILQGREIRDLPCEIARFFMGINLKSARDSGIEVPNDILIQADFVIR